MSTRALQDYWRRVRAGEIPAPARKPAAGAAIKRTLAQLDGSFGPDRGKRLVVTLHPDGRLEIRPERSRRSESIMLSDVYRFAIQTRVGYQARVKAAARRDRKMERLAAQRRARAEKRLLRPD